ncbi:MAG: hypothetical protein ACRCW3_04050 [Metamycoplasmataceae bacterium]
MGKMGHNYCINIHYKSSNYLKTLKKKRYYWTKINLIDFTKKKFFYFNQALRVFFWPEDPECDWKTGNPRGLSYTFLSATLTGAVRVGGADLVYQ